MSILQPSGENSTTSTTIRTNCSSCSVPHWFYSTKHFQSHFGDCVMLTWRVFLLSLLSAYLAYRKVASSSQSRLVAPFQIFRRLMKVKFDAYVLSPLAKKSQNWIVDRSTARDFTVYAFERPQPATMLMPNPHWHIFLNTLFLVLQPLLHWKYSFLAGCYGCKIIFKIEPFAILISIDIIVSERFVFNFSTFN